jgi:hypothetical protein
MKLNVFVTPRVPRLSRRTLLRGAGGVAIALPFLEIMAPRKARGAGAAKSLVVLFNVNGYAHSRWLPKGSETNFSLAGTSLAPIADAGLQNDVVVINGIENKALKISPGAGHPKGTGTALTCRPLSDGNFVGGGGQAAGFASGISIDQVIRPVIDPGPGRNSLELGVVARRRDAAGHVSYTEKATPLPPQNDPQLVFNRLFSQQIGDPLALERHKARKTSVLDYAKEDCARVRAMLGQADREKFDRYCAQVADTQKAVQALQPAQCNEPVLGQVPDTYQTQKAPELFALQLQLLTLALKCDLVRVASLMFGYGGGGGGLTPEMAYTWLGFTRGHHGQSHSSPLLPGPAAELAKVNEWWTKALFVPLIQRLKAETGVDGRPLLDSTLVVWTNELGNADLHRADHLPFVLAGKLGGALRTGRFLDLQAAPSTNSFYLAMAQSFGVPITTFGSPQFCPGPLAGLFS